MSQQRTVAHETLNITALKDAIETCVDRMGDAIERLERAHRSLDDTLTKVVPDIELGLIKLEQTAKHATETMVSFVAMMRDANGVMKDQHAIMSAPGLNQEIKRMEDFLQLAAKIKDLYDSGLLEALLAMNEVLDKKVKP